MKSLKLDVLSEWDNNYEKEGYISSSEELCNALLSDSVMTDVEELIIGSWGEEYENSCQYILDLITDNSEKFKQLKSIFIGDMSYEVCEISWINQGNYSKIWGALPNLEKLTIKGGTELVLGDIKHNNLKELEIISGGTDVCVFESIANAELPNLETLKLYVGVEDYGFNGGLDDIKNLVEKLNSFKSLKYLGIVNSELMNHIALVVLESELIKRLDVVDFSCGTLHDIGAKYIIKNKDKIKHLKMLVLDNSFFSKEIYDIFKDFEIPVSLKKVQVLKKEEKTLDEELLNSDKEYTRKYYEKLLKTYNLEKIDFENATLEDFPPELLMEILPEYDIYPLYTE